MKILICQTVLLLLLFMATTRSVRSLDLSSSSGQQQQTKLEDIERDNLLSERRTKGEKLQSIRVAPIVHSQITYQHEARDASSDHQSLSVGGGGGVTYVNQGQEIQYEQEGGGGGGGGVQYVTSEPEQYAQQQNEYIQQQQQHQQPSYTPVHEADRTYSAPSRHSLVNPTVPTPPIQHFVTPQPQFVYVQVQQQQQQLQQQQQQQQQQHQEQQIHQQEQHQHQQEQEQQQHQQLHQQQEQLVYPQQQQSIIYPQPQEQIHPQYIQYVPQYVPQYVSQAQQYQQQQHHQQQQQTPAFVMIPYTQGQANAYVNSYAPQQQYQTLPHIESSSYSQLPSIGSTISTPIQVGPRYTTTSTAVPQHYDYSQEKQFLHQIQQTLPYTPAPIYDFYNYHNRHPTSLLDSYIPSSLLYARQHKSLQTYIPDHSLSLGGGHGYNTIAYSAPLSYNHKKRSN